MKMAPAYFIKISKLLLKQETVDTANDSNSKAAPE